MSFRRAVAAFLVSAMTVGASPALMQAGAQNTGVISGKAVDEAKKPYTDYSVQLRDPATGLVVATTTLNAQALFSFSGLAIGKQYQVELVQVKKNEIVCKEGPYSLTSSVLSKTDVNINCGTNPAVWLIPAGAAAVIVAVAVQSKK